jgi:ABC-type methionine transport system ATPase subunit
LPSRSIRSPPVSCSRWFTTSCRSGSRSCSAITARRLRLEFVGATAQQPIINRIIKDYAIEVNILFASMSEVQGRILGFMIVQILGEPEQTGRAIAHLATQE